MSDKEIMLIIDLLTKARSNQLTKEEKEELDTWISDNPELHEELLQAVNNIAEIQADMLSKQKVLAVVKNRMVDADAPAETPGQAVQDSGKLRTFGKRMVKIVASIAAAFFLFALGTVYWFARSHKKNILSNQTAKQYKNDVAPGGNRALLTLGNGDKIVLDSAGNGVLSRQGNTQIQKLRNGQIAYNALNAKPGEIYYNTLTTPRGGQYQLLLPDGSQVWLNAASSIKYPTAFDSKERRVEITGEAYFEIAPLRRPSQKGEGTEKIPFVVDVVPSPGRNKSQVEVLGTHFNITAYGDESTVSTTLVEGSVNILIPSSGRPLQQVRLKPGQQAQILTPETRLPDAGQTAGADQGRTMIKILNAVDTDGIVAWKNGHFHFEKASIQMLMLQLSRWYDVEVIFKKGAGTNHLFSGDIQRNLTLAQVAEILSDHVHFTIEGKKIIVES